MWNRIRRKHKDTSIRIHKELTREKGGKWPNNKWAINLQLSNSSLGNYVGYKEVQGQMLNILLTRNTQIRATVCWLCPASKMTAIIKTVNSQRLQACGMAGNFHGMLTWWQLCMSLVMGSCHTTCNYVSKKIWMQRLSGKHEKVRKPAIHSFMIVQTWAGARAY